MAKVRNIVFDCNETLLDLTTVTPVFERLFGEPAIMRLWFRELITYSQALTIADVYVPPSPTLAVQSSTRSRRPRE
jgi:2-haloacid dehalogenase